MSTPTLVLRPPRPVNVPGYKQKCPVCGQEFTSDSKGRLQSNVKVHIESQHPERLKELSAKPTRAKRKSSKKERFAARTRAIKNRPSSGRWKHKRAGDLASNPHPPES